MVKSRLLHYDEALTKILEHVEALPSGQTTLDSALGRVLRKNVIADRDQPPFDRCTMDGFAVRSVATSAGKTFVVSGEIAAGAPVPAFPDDHQCVMRIATGAPMPDGADAVVPIEQSVIERDGNAERVRFKAESVQPGQNVHRQGIDAGCGQVVIRAGTRLAPHHIGIAANVGPTQVEVAEKPQITLLTSGDEVRPTGTSTDQLEPHQIRNTNGPMLTAFCRALGADVLRHEHVPDEPGPTLEAARKALGDSRLVLTTGGVSVGRRDLLGMTWNQLDVQQILHGVAIQPGKPLFVARSGVKLVMGLPGNPVSVLATAHLFLWPTIRKLLGMPHDLPWRMVALTHGVPANRARQVFRAARISGDGNATVIPWHGSGDLAHTTEADGLVRLPLLDGHVHAGAHVPFLRLLS